MLAKRTTLSGCTHHAHHVSGPPLERAHRRVLGPRIDHVKLENLDPASIGIARDFDADVATDYTPAALGIDFGGGQRCKQSLNRGADGSCPSPVPACR